MPYFPRECFHTNWDPSICVSLTPRKIILYGIFGATIRAIEYISSLYPEHGIK
jgi:hypothetical protein